MDSRIEEEWQIVDYYPCLPQENDEKSNLGWIIDVGKKLVITGVVVSSLPLLLPPLAVISALGFAFSVPYGVVFASYACTQKLMSKLLPAPPLSGDFHRTIGAKEEDQEAPAVGAGIEEEEKEKSKHMEAGTGMRIELVGDGDRDEIRDELDIYDGGDKGEQHSLEKPYLLTNEYAMVAHANFSVQVPSEKNVMNKKGSMEHFPSQDKDEKVEKVVTETNKENKRQARRGKKKNIVGGPVGKEIDLLPQESMNNHEAKLQLGEKTAVLEEKSTDEGESKEADKNVKKRHLSMSDDTGDNEEENKAFPKTAESDSIGNGELVGEKKELQKVMVLDDSGVTVDYSESRTTSEDTNLELKNDEEIHSLKEEKDGSLHFDEFQEEEIWEKIDAIRAIVGFKAPKLSSYIEEVKALYVFTGIEPPTTSLAEFSTRLSFLMSVIGLK